MGTRKVMDGRVRLTTVCGLEVTILLDCQLVSLNSFIDLVPKKHGRCQCSR